MEQPATNADRTIRRNYFSEASSLVKRLRLLTEHIDAAIAVENAAIQAAQAKRIRDTQDQTAERADIMKQLTQLLLEHKRFFWARFGKTLTLEDGVVRYRTDAKSLDTPKNTAAVVKFLLRMPGGKRYLIVKYALNRDALTHANPSLLRKLAPLGVRAGKYANITVKLEGQSDPISLSRERFPRRKSTR